MAQSDIVNICFSRKRKSLEFQALALGYGNFKSGNPYLSLHGLALLNIHPQSRIEGMEH
jgi:hypothetical protein